MADIEEIENFTVNELEPKKSRRSNFSLQKTADTYTEGECRTHSQESLKLVRSSQPGSGPYHVWRVCKVWQCSGYSPGLTGVVQNWNSFNVVTGLIVGGTGSQYWNNNSYLPGANNAGNDFYDYISNLLGPVNIGDQIELDISHAQPTVTIPPAPGSTSSTTINVGSAVCLSATFPNSLFPNAPNGTANKFCFEYLGTATTPVGVSVNVGNYQWFGSFVTILPYESTVITVKNNKCCENYCYNIGDTGPGGGTIFSVPLGHPQNNGVNQTNFYYEVAKNDVNPGGSTPSSFYNSSCKIPEEPLVLSAIQRVFVGGPSSQILTGGAGGPYVTGQGPNPMATIQNLFNNYSPVRVEWFASGGTTQQLTPNNVPLSGTPPSNWTSHLPTGTTLTNISYVGPQSTPVLTFSNNFINMANYPVSGGPLTGIYAGDHPGGPNPDAFWGVVRFTGTLPASSTTVPTFSAAGNEFGAFDNNISPLVPTGTLSTGNFHEFGIGHKNTYDIAASPASWPNPTANIHPTLPSRQIAAQECLNYQTTGVYKGKPFIAEDWFLPSLGEFEEIRNQINQGNIPNVTFQQINTYPNGLNDSSHIYWTSTIVDYQLNPNIIQNQQDYNKYAWVYKQGSIGTNPSNPSGLSPNIALKCHPLSVRAIRRFECEVDDDGDGVMYDYRLGRSQVTDGFPGTINSFRNGTRQFYRIEVFTDIYSLEMPIRDEFLNLEVLNNGANVFGTTFPNLNGITITNLNGDIVPLYTQQGQVLLRYQKVNASQASIDYFDNLTVGQQVSYFNPNVIAPPIQLGPLRRLEFDNDDAYLWFGNYDPQNPTAPNAGLPPLNISALFPHMVGTPHPTIPNAVLTSHVQGVPVPWEGSVISTKIQDVLYDTHFLIDSNALTPVAEYNTPPYPIPSQYSYLPTAGGPNPPYYYTPNGSYLYVNTTMGSLFESAPYAGLGDIDEVIDVATHPNYGPAALALFQAQTGTTVDTIIVFKSSGYLPTWPTPGPGFPNQTLNMKDWTFDNFPKYSKVAPIKYIHHIRHVNPYFSPSPFGPLTQSQINQNITPRMEIGHKKLRIRCGSIDVRGNSIRQLMHLASFFNTQTQKRDNHYNGQVFNFKVYDQFEKLICDYDYTLMNGHIWRTYGSQPPSPNDEVFQYPQCGAAQCKFQVLFRLYAVNYVDTSLPNYAVGTHPNNLGNQIIDLSPYFGERSLWGRKGNAYVKWSLKKTTPAGFNWNTFFTRGNTLNLENWLGFGNHRSKDPNNLPAAYNTTRNRFQWGVICNPCGKWTYPNQPTACVNLRLGEYMCEVPYSLAMTHCAQYTGSFNVYYPGLGGIDVPLTISSGQGWIDHADSGCPDTNSSTITADLNAKLAYQDPTHEDCDENEERIVFITKEQEPVSRRGKFVKSKKIKETGPFGINGYYPLFDTIAGAIENSPTPIQARNEKEDTFGYHIHEFEGIEYYMPNGLEMGVTQFHGDYDGQIIPEVTIEEQQVKVEVEVEEITIEPVQELPSVVTITPIEPEQEEEPPAPTPTPTYTPPPSTPSSGSGSGGY